ncbi:hydantoinase/oxoprolinase family protein [Bradyrhizobium brasilense]|uniref:hydantoinase/oxoprolinase family protein n=1 Tax=Bradyrhizobium brasilense TaxID=1419277 RepID=UPI0024B0C503|nr:hydantoinase/oxoprolinase family protein [Bradyrhizobium australafricanum]WFU31341.1 hydantoinase/oxoprolinase family protein [Bradyrhizobium australafricanum]
MKVTSIRSKTERNQKATATAPWRIGVDVGGTFTDLVLADGAGSLFTFKAPTDVLNPALGVMAALALAADGLHRSIQDLLGHCRVFVHGSTIATNTVLERTGAVVGLLTTEGFRDALEIRRGFRENVWDHRAPLPEPLVPRHLRLPVRERMDKNGCPIRVPEPESISRAVDTFRREGVTSIAICLLNSYRNDSHERICADLIRNSWPEACLSVSADIAPVLGEYERTSTTVLNAYVTPRVVPYLRQLERNLRAQGLAHPLLLIQSNGGAASVEQLVDRAILLALSGPAAGASALRAVAEMADRDDLLLMEIGGTSCDVTLMDGGEIATVDSFSLNEYHLTIPSVDIHSISGGGGIIATVDSGGLLNVGPHGAGAQPGPACYGLGGEDPTITDAQVVLGRIRAGSFGEGLIKLDPAPARKTIEERIATRLGLDTIAAASGVIRILEQSLQHTIERVSVERGHDPRRFTLVAGGGAGALHAVPVARALGCEVVYVPRFAGVFCAFGMCSTDIREDLLETWLKLIDQESSDAIERGFARLIASAKTRLVAGGFAMSDLSFKRSLDLRYVGQQHSLQVPFDVWDIPSIRADFEARYQRQFGHCPPDGRIEIIHLRLVGSAQLSRVRRPNLLATEIDPVPYERRSVYVDPLFGFRVVPVYHGNEMCPGQSLRGPALIEEKNTTILIGPSDRLEIDASDNFLIHVAKPAEQRDD